jgi:hypothetical protein
MPEMNDMFCQEVLGMVEAFHVEMLANYLALWPTQHEPSTKEDPGHKAQSYGNKPIDWGSMTKGFSAEWHSDPEAINNLYKLVKKISSLT